MTLTTRLILTVILSLLLTGSILAQESTAPTSTATSTVAPTPTTTAPAPAVEQTDPETDASRREEIRSGLNRVVRQHPSEVAEILSLDPTLLLNEQFVSRYPDVAAFVAANPEVRRNPHYYTRNFKVYHPPQVRSPLEDAIETFSIILVFFLIAVALAWLVRSIIEQKRWNQLARRQSDVHSKILDRFSTSDELLQYIKSPAGTKYLESAPISVQTEPVKTSPYARITLTVQIGVIVAAAGIGMMLTGARFTGSGGDGFFAMGMIAFCIGGGFIASAFVSIFLTRRLEAHQVTTNPIEDPGVMR